MKSFLSICFLLSLTPSIIVAEPMSNAEREVRHLEQLLNDALSNVDVKTIDKIWANDFVFVTPAGRIANRAQRMAGLKPVDPSGPSLISTLDELQVHVYPNSVIAIVKTTWRGNIAGKSIIDPYVATHVWVRSGASWRLAAAHVSQVEVQH